MKKFLLLKFYPGIAQLESLFRFCSYTPTFLINGKLTKILHCYKRFSITFLILRMRGYFFYFFLEKSSKSLYLKNDKLNDIWYFKGFLVDLDFFIKIFRKKKLLFYQIFFPLQHGQNF